jgi:hypothetical protein
MPQFSSFEIQFRPGFRKHLLGIAPIGSVLRNARGR